MQVCKITLPYDDSAIKVQRLKDGNKVSYFLPELKCWIRSTGEIELNKNFPDMLGDHGIVKDENAKIFRMLIKLQEMKDYLIEILQTKTTLFKEN